MYNILNLSHQLKQKEESELQRTEIKKLEKQLQEQNHELQRLGMQLEQYRNELDQKMSVEQTGRQEDQKNLAFRVSTIQENIQQTISRSQETVQQTISKVQESVQQKVSKSDVKDMMKAEAAEVLMNTKPAMQEMVKKSELQLRVELSRSQETVQQTVSKVQESVQQKVSKSDVKDMMKAEAAEFLMNTKPAMQEMVEKSELQLRVELSRHEIEKKKLEKQLLEQNSELQRLGMRLEQYQNEQKAIVELHTKSMDEASEILVNTKAAMQEMVEKSEHKLGDELSRQHDALEEVSYLKESRNSTPRNVEIEYGYYCGAISISYLYVTGHTCKVLRLESLSQIASEAI